MNTERQDDRRNDNDPGEPKLAGVSCRPVSPPRKAETNGEGQYQARERGFGT